MLYSNANDQAKMSGIYTIFCDDRLSMKSFIMFLIPLIIISFVSFGEETDKLKHTIFLGNNAPIDSNDGLSTLLAMPLINFEHKKYTDY